jgi:hypothetical protein
MIPLRGINRYGLAQPVTFVVFHVETKLETQQDPVLNNYEMAGKSIGELEMLCEKSV